MRTANNSVATSKAAQQQALRYVATNLFRSATTTIYYAMLMVNGKQYHRSLYANRQNNSIGTRCEIYIEIPLK